MTTTDSEKSNDLTETQRPEPTSSASDEQLKLAQAAIIHVLNAIADDPQKFWLLGDMTGSHEKLTAAAAAMWNVPQDKIKADFRPRKDVWERYCAQREADERLIEYCRENGITGEV